MYLYDVFRHFLHHFFNHWSQKIWVNKFLCLQYRFHVNVHKVINVLPSNHFFLLYNILINFYYRLTLFIASSSFIILTLITIIGAVSCFILCNEDRDFSQTQKSFIQSMSSSSNLNLNLLGQTHSTGMQQTTA